MPFVESPRFPDGVARGFSGGPGFLTDVVELESGYEQRNQVLAEPLGSWSASMVGMTEAERDAVIAFFRAVAKGRANGFRFKDWNDYTVAAASGRLGTGAVGTGLPTYQLYKRYASGSSSADRAIEKPVSGQVAVQRNASPVTIGAGAGEISIDTTTGIVTFVADASQAIAAITPGVTTVVQINTDVGLSAGEKLHLSGISGTAAATLNGIAHTIANKTGAGPYDYTLSVDTNGLTASGGAAAAYPQADDALIWSGEFDNPARLREDGQELRALARNAAGFVSEWPVITLRELRV